MARIQKLESDSSFTNSNILPGTVMTWKRFDGSRIRYMGKLPDGSVVEITPEVDFSDYYTKVEVDAIAGELSDSISALNQKFDNYYTKSEVDELIAGTSDSFSLSNYYTKSEVDALIGDLSDSIAAVNQKFSSYYTKEETGQILSDSYYTKSQLYTKDQVDALIQGLSNSTSYYTKEEVDVLLGDKYDLSDAQQLEQDVQALKDSSPKVLSFSSVSSNIYTIEEPVVVVGVFNNLNQYFPVQKGSVDYSNSNTYLNVTAYLAYSNQSSFTGTWKAIVLAPEEE